MAVTVEGVDRTWNGASGLVKLVKFGTLFARILPGKHVVHLGGQAFDLARIHDIAAGAHFGLLALHAPITLAKANKHRASDSQLVQWSHVGLATADFTVAALFLHTHVRPFLPKTAPQFTERLMFGAFMVGASANLAAYLKYGGSNINTVAAFSLLAYALAETGTWMYGADSLVLGKVSLWKVRTGTGIASGLMNLRSAL